MFSILLLVFSIIGFCFISEQMGKVEVTFCQELYFLNQLWMHIWYQQQLFLSNGFVLSIFISVIGKDWGIPSPDTLIESLSIFTVSLTATTRFEPIQLDFPSLIAFSRIENKAEAWKFSNSTFLCI